jgi:hypothetical protein
MSYVSDQLLQPFLASDFDPVNYLNSTLPSLTIHSSASAVSQYPKRSTSSTNTASLADISAQTQTLLSQLNAQITRLSTTLTQLTDDILRSGGRLAYEVEVLRGETAGLTEVLTDGLQEDVARFVKNPLKISTEDSILQSGTGTTPDAGRRRSSAAATTPAPADGDETEQAHDAEDSGEDVPEYVTQLRTLTQVRARLDSVVQVFGEAMQWTIPPSEISSGPSIISVSAPEPGSDSHDREEKGKEFAERLRNEIADTITGASKDAGGDGQKGYEAAMARIQALRDLSTVWKGTAEEKARTKFIDGLIKLAEERAKTFTKDTSGTSHAKSRAGTTAPSSTAPKAKSSEKGSGFLENLQRIRDNIYLD